MAECFERRASGQGERNCAKDIGVAEVNRRLGNKPQESDEAPTNDVPGNRMSIRVVIIV